MAFPYEYLDMNEEFVKKLHQAICSYYISMHGHSLSQLQSWRFNFVECVTIPELKKIVDNYGSNELVPIAFKELVTRGYLSQLEWGYNLTPLGLKEGTKNIFDLLLDFLNRNPGLISVIAIIISLFSLYISYTKS